MKWRRGIIAGVLLLLGAGAAVAQNEYVDVATQRMAYQQAYNAGANAAAIKLLCDTLHEQVTFRGKFMPGVWTGPRDSLVHRWTRGAIVDCTGKAGASVAPRVIGSNTLTLSPTSIQKLGDSTVLETGIFDMRAIVPEGKQYEVTQRYVLIWVKDKSARWVLKHIDMDP